MHPRKFVESSLSGEGIETLTLTPTVTLTLSHSLSITGPARTFSGHRAIFHANLHNNLNLTSTSHPFSSQSATMGFSITNEQGLPALEEWLKTRSYIEGYAPSQADVAVLKAVNFNVNAAKFPNVTRWRRHLKTFEDEFSLLRGDASKPHTAYGPAAAATEDDDDEDVDLFGSDDEEEDAEAAKVREERLAEYGTFFTHIWPFLEHWC